MNIEEEKKRIKDFFDQMTDSEVYEMLVECGLNTINPTDEIRKKYYPEVCACVWQ